MSVLESGKVVKLSRVSTVVAMSCGPLYGLGWLQSAAKALNYERILRFIDDRAPDFTLDVRRKVKLTFTTSVGSVSTKVLKVKRCCTQTMPEYEAERLPEHELYILQKIRISLREYA